MTRVAAVAVFLAILAPIPHLAFAQAFALVVGIVYDLGLLEARCAE